MSQDPIRQLITRPVIQSRRSHQRHSRSIRIQRVDDYLRRIRLAFEGNGNIDADGSERVGNDSAEDFYGILNSSDGNSLSQPSSDIDSQSDLNYLEEAIDNEATGFGDQEMVHPDIKSYQQAVILSLIKVADLNLSQLQKVVDIFNMYLKRYGERDQVLPNARYFWVKKASQISMDCYVFCENCPGKKHGPFRGEPKHYGVYTCSGQQKVVELRNGNFFIHLPLMEQLEKKLPLLTEDFWLRKPITQSPTYQPNWDISTARLAKNCQGKNVFTMNLHADEVPVASSSKLRIFPVFISLNDLKPSIRYKNFFLLGLFVGWDKPDYESFLGILSRDLEDVAGKSISWTSRSGQTHTGQFKTIGVIADAVMRAFLRGVKQFNSTVGCDWCYIRAENFMHARAYPLVKPEDIRRRSHQDFLDFQSMVPGSPDLQEERFESFRWATPLVQISSLDLVRGFATEPMHSILLGTFREIITKGWLKRGNVFSTQPRANSFCETFSQRLLRVKTPSNLSRGARDISLIAFWSSKELEHMLAYFSPLLLEGILPDICIFNILILAKVYYLAYRPPINERKLIKLRHLIYQFQKQVVNVYGKAFASYNLHILAHIPDSISDLGPLAFINSYPLEDLMKKFKSLVFRYHEAPKALIRAFMMRSNYFDFKIMNMNHWNLNAEERNIFELDTDEVVDSRKTNRIFLKPTSRPDNYQEIINIILSTRIVSTEQELRFMESIARGKRRLSIFEYSSKVESFDCIFMSREKKIYQVEALFNADSQDFIVCKCLRTVPFRKQFTRECSSPITLSLDYIFKIQGGNDHLEIFPFSSLLEVMIYIPLSQVLDHGGNDYVILPYLVNY